MSTFRFFAKRLVSFARHGLKLLLGRPAQEFARQIPQQLPRVFTGSTSAPGSSRAVGILQQVLRGMQRGTYTGVRAASMGLWRNAGRRAATRFPVGGLAGALLAARHYSVGIFDQIKDIFGEDNFKWQFSAGNRVYPKNLAAYDIGSHIAVGCNAVVYEARVKPENLHGHYAKRRFDPPEVQVESEKLEEEEDFLLSSNERKRKYPLAMKMMFNYEFSSQEARIVREMGNELVPVLDKSVQNILRRDQRPLPNFHPNIVEVYTAFVDSLPLLPGAEELYPCALPPELYDEGLGRSKTMFLVMKRYSMTLYEYLLYLPCPVRVGQVLLGQLLEALVYLKEQKISHRDMKSNNILVEFDNPDDVPFLVLSDFGCCMSSGQSLELPYPHEFVDLGGNVALRPPEVRNATPGLYRKVDYSKADLWGAGTLAYEIFTKVNPFYRKLDSATYKESELPELSPTIPLCIRRLVLRVLKRDPSKRPTPNCAGNVVGLSLFRVDNFRELLSQMGVKLSEFSPTVWLKLSEAVSLYAAETILKSEILSKAELQLRSTFLARLDRGEIWDAVPYFLANDGSGLAFAYL